MTKKWLWFMILGSIGVAGKAQNIDSLLRKLPSMQGIKAAHYLNRVADRTLHTSPAQVIPLAEKALAIAQKAHNDTVQIIARLQISSAYFQMGNYDKALQLYWEILEASKHIHYDKGMANCYNNLGNVFFMKGKLDNAYQYYERSQQIEQKLGNEVGIAESYENMALVLDNQKQYEKSRDLFQKALQLYKKLGKQAPLPILYNNIGVSFRAQAQYEQALQYFQAAAQINAAGKEKESLAYNWQNIGITYRRKGDTQAAIDYLLKSVDLAQEFKHIRKDNYEELALAYAQQKDYEKAYQYHQRFAQVRDSIFSEESEKRIQELHTRYETVQKEQKIQFQSLEIQQKNNWIYGISALSILALALAGLYYNRYLLKTRANSVIKQAMHEKEVLLQEIHHRVKNNLQLVSSLLSWQSEYVQDAQMQLMIEENISRIKSMALIHENLYLSPHISEVSAGEYLKGIIQHLQKTFDAQASVVIDYQISPLLLNAEQIIPIGLIVNELITNAYKYAFAPAEIGKISILFEKQAEKYHLKVYDTGQGLPTNYEEKSKKSLGLQLVQLLVRQLKGKLQIQKQNPTTFEVTF